MVVWVSKLLWDDLVKARMEEGYAPNERIRITSYKEYVIARPRAPKEI